MVRLALRDRRMSTAAERGRHEARPQSRWRSSWWPSPSPSRRGHGHRHERTRDDLRHGGSRQDRRQGRRRQDLRVRRERRRHRGSRCGSHRGGSGQRPSACARRTERRRFVRAWQGHRRCRRADAVRGCEVVRRPAARRLRLRLRLSRRPRLRSRTRSRERPAGRRSESRRAARSRATPCPARPGETITFHISAEPDASYRILVYRIGWYGGVGARRSSPLRSQLGGADEAGGAGGQPRPRPRRLARDTSRSPPTGSPATTSFTTCSRAALCGQLERQLADRPRLGRTARRCLSRRACRRGRPTTAGAAAACTRSTAPAGTGRPRSRSTGRSSVSR